MEDSLSYKSIFKSLFDNSYEGIIISDFEHVILEINPTFEKISGYSREEALGRSLLEFLPASCHEKIKIRRERLKTEGRVELGNYELIDKSGGTRILEVSSITIPYYNDTAVLSILRDITEKTEIEKQLLKQIQFSENIIRSLPGVFYLVELVNDEPLLIKWNENFKKESLLTDEELYKLNVLDFFNEEEKKQTRANIKRLLHGEIDFIQTIQNPILKDGTIMRYLYQSVGSRDGEKFYYLGTGIDISDKRDLERKLIESVIQTEESERRRIASDLHDGLGPELSAIKLYIQSLLDTKNEDAKNEIGSKLMKLVEHTVDSISEISYNISPHILLNHGLEASINNFLNKLKINPEIKIVTHFDEIQRFGINEELTLYRTITELFHNSLKHASASKITLDINVKEDIIYVEFTDNGKGFSVKNEIEKKEGMGIQNMISRIESLEGTFKLKSKVNEGMSASICLPYIIKNE